MLVGICLFCFSIVARETRKDRGADLFLIVCWAIGSCFQKVGLWLQRKVFARERQRARARGVGAGHCAREGRGTRNTCYTTRRRVARRSYAKPVVASSCRE